MILGVAAFGGKGLASTARHLGAPDNTTVIHAKCRFGGKEVVDNLHAITHEIPGVDVLAIGLISNG